MSTLCQERNLDLNLNNEQIKPNNKPELKKVNKNPIIKDNILSGPDHALGQYYLCALWYLQSGLGRCVLSTGIKRANSGGYWKLPGQADKVDFFPFSYFLLMTVSPCRQQPKGATSDPPTNQKSAELASNESDSQMHTGETNPDDPLATLLKPNIVAALLATSLKDGDPSQADADTNELNTNSSTTEPNEAVSETA